ncbi:MULTISPECIES: hypothetical protein [Streptomyces]|uniref:hypothetical protein n=1 Tax=Streptomyces TaxID=1883 RepID=UPI00163CDD9C|nr:MULTISPECIES: hypothetical protein [Streptomyces]GLX23095.1 hypothetical protein Slala01_67390 [Streptomyces lavendulae subsp. lavendulae]GLX30557.1 hypothetical protein Slala02_63770 [Streptomyces lavendulae subsp. lavendulae]
MNAVQTVGYRVPAREPAPGAVLAPRPCAAPPLTTLLRRRAAWVLAVAKARRSPSARSS